MRFQPMWMDQYQEDEIPQGIEWGIKDGLKIDVRASGTISSHKFLDSAPQLKQPEDPNLGYPPGHFVPFPMAILELAPQNEIWVAFKLIDE
jgi:hypothetical protein